MQTHRRARGPFPLSQSASILLVIVAYLPDGIWSESLEDLRSSWSTARTPGWSALYSGLIRLTDMQLIEYDPTTTRSRITAKGRDRARREAQLLARKGIKITRPHSWSDSVGKDADPASAAAS